MTGNTHTTHTTHTPNARFWVLGPQSEPVKLTLKPGQILTYRYGGPTDEGYDWRTEAYAHEGDAVRAVWSNDARDCDGHYLSGGEYVCDLADLSTGWTDDVHPDVRYPRWQHEDEYNHDFTAEAAGY